MTLLAKEEPLYKEKEDAYSSWYVFSDQDLRTGLPAPDHFSLNAIFFQRPKSRSVDPCFYFQHVLGYSFLSH